MARVACRWPGGINIHIKKTGIPAAQWPQRKLNGPRGSLTEGLAGDPLRSPQSAHALRQRHVQKLQELTDSRDRAHEEPYAETYVHDDFWRAWVAQQEHFARHHNTPGMLQNRIVFEIK